MEGFTKKVGLDKGWFLQRERKAKVKISQTDFFGDIYQQIQGFRVYCLRNGKALIRYKSIGDGSSQFSNIALNAILNVLLK